MTQLGETAPGYIGIGQAHGNVDSVVSGSNPHVHTGSGTQVAGDVGVVIISDPDQGGHERRHHAQPLSHSREQREYLRKRFVDPPGFAQAQNHLAHSGTVFLSGQPGCGRASAAMMLLWRNFPNNDASFRRLTLDDEEADTALDPHSVQCHETLLLDLCNADSDGLAVVRRRLDTFRAAVEHNNAALVVVLPTESDHHLGEDFSYPRVTIERPPGIEVIRQHLIENDVPLPERLPDPLANHLETETMRGLERLAGRIAAAQEKQPKSGFAHWATLAIDTIADVKPTVAEQVRQCSPAQRAMLLAASMVDGAHLDSAHTARNWLLQELSYPADERHILEREGLEESLRAVAVERTESHLIKFSSPRYSEAVRSHFWTNYPELRAALRDWVKECVHMPELSDYDTDRLVARFARQACQVGRAQDLWTLAEQWTRHPDEQRPASRTTRWAASALAYGLTAEAVSDDEARGLRRRIYQAAHNTNQQNDLASVLVSVCAGVMADEHPDQALVRLRLLTAHRSTDVATSARHAIHKLCENHRFYRRFLWRMATWLGQQRWPSDLDLFLAAVQPHRLLDPGSRTDAALEDRSVRKQLTACWRNVLLFDTSMWRASVGQWLAVARTESTGGLLLNVLAAATDGQLTPLATLYVLARDWAHSAHTPEERAARQEIVREFTGHLNQEQQLRLNN